MKRYGFADMGRLDEVEGGCWCLADEAINEIASKDVEIEKLREALAFDHTKVPWEIEESCPGEWLVHAGDDGSRRVGKTIAEVYDKNCANLIVTVPEMQDEIASKDVKIEKLCEALTVGLSAIRANLTHALLKNETILLSALLHLESTLEATQKK